VATRLPKTDSPSSASAGPRDYVAIADAFAVAAAGDRRGARYGKWVRLAARRYLADRKRAEAKRAPFRFDPALAAEPCAFIEELPHVEGRWATPTIQLHPSHVFFIVNIFGFRKPDGNRRFTSALLAVARKNAKSTIAAAILLYCLCCEAEVGPQVISGATTGDQARIVFGVGKRMVEKEADLREAYTLTAYANAIARADVGGTFKPINAKASTQDGLNPSHVVLDEVHAHKTHDLLNVLQSAAGARANPLWLYTTTEGYETPGPWPELRHFAKQVLEEVVEADHFFALYFAVDDKDDDFDESKWVKANPLMDVNPVLATELRKAAIEAKAMPGRAAEFRIKRLNRPSAAATAWVDLRKWKRCDGAVDLEMLRDYPCWGGLDLASTRDLNALRLVWFVKDMLYTWGRRWVPADAVAQRTERGTVPYAAWVEAGHIIQTPGDVSDYDVIEADILAVRERFPRLEIIAYDSWNAADLVRRLGRHQVPMVEFIQGPKSYHPAMQELERRYRPGKLAHAGDPVLAWCASNLVPRYDANMNGAPDKKRAAEKIDDMAALLMAIGAKLSTESTTLPDDYELAVA
jgi:phage terminase large subunit-like protein